MWIGSPMNEKTDGIIDRLDKIEINLRNLNLKGEEKSSKGDQILEVEGDWDPFI